MAFDYTPIANTAKTLIENFGRSMTFIRLSRAADDANKPWRSTATPRTSPDASTTVTALMVEPGNDLGALGEQVDIPDLTTRTGKILIVAAASAPGVDLETYDEVLDDGVYYKAQVIHALQPGATKLLYFFEVTSIGS